VRSENKALVNMKRPVCLLHTLYNIYTLKLASTLIKALLALVPSVGSSKWPTVATQVAALRNIR
jgi:hypothetical protein